MSGCSDSYQDRHWSITGQLRQIFSAVSFSPDSADYLTIHASGLPVSLHAALIRQSIVVSEDIPQVLPGGLGMVGRQLATQLSRHGIGLGARRADRVAIGS